MNEVDQVKEVLSVHLEYINKRFDKVERKIDDLTASGCERGRMNAKAIVDLQTANKNAAQRAGATAGGLISIIGGCIALVIEYLRRAPQ